MTTTQDPWHQLLAAIAATEPREMDCDEFLARVGAYVEALGGRLRQPAGLAGISQHREVCPECEEEFQLLIELTLPGAASDLDRAAEDSPTPSE